MEQAELRAQVEVIEAQGEAQALELVNRAIQDQPFIAALSLDQKSAGAGQGWSSRTARRSRRPGRRLPPGITAHPVGRDEGG